MTEAYLIKLSDKFISQMAGEIIKGAPVALITVSTETPGAVSFNKRPLEVTSIKARFVTI
jgi:hypothetical protein